MIDIGMCVYFDLDSLLCFCLNYCKIVLMSSIGREAVTETTSLVIILFVIILFHTFAVE